MAAKINALADEDLEQDPDRWCSHAEALQELWQLISQWVSPLRLELGHQLAADPLRTTEFREALLPGGDGAAPASGTAGTRDIPRRVRVLLHSRCGTEKVHND